jgi:hypothetical protein
VLLVALLLPNICDVSVERDTEDGTVAWVWDRLWIVVLVVFGNGRLILEIGEELANEMVELEIPSMDEEEKLNGRLVVVVTVEVKVVGAIVTVVKEVSVLDPWDVVEFAAAEGL